MLTPADFVHTALLALGGEVLGKTALQKKLFFIGALTDLIEELGYRAHFYGPYSDEIAQAVQDLRTIGYMEQDVRSLGLTDSAGFERCRYDFRLTEAGERVAKAKAEKLGGTWTKIQESANRLRDAGNPDYMKLSVAAKTYFLLGQSGARPSKEELAQLASKFGWRVAPEEIEEAVKYLEKLELLPQST